MHADLILRYSLACSMFGLLTISSTLIGWFAVSLFCLFAYLSPCPTFTCFASGLEIQIVFLSASVYVFTKICIVSKGPDLSGTLPRVHEGDARRSTPNLHRGRAEGRHWVLRFLRHEHIHDQPLQYVSSILSDTVGSFTGCSRSRRGWW